MKIEQMIRLVSDLEHFAPRDDQLSELIRENEDELDENELELVAAAAAKPTFRELLEKRK